MIVVGTEYDKRDVYSNEVQAWKGENEYTLKMGSRRTTIGLRKI